MDDKEEVKRVRLIIEPLTMRSLNCIGIFTYSGLLRFNKEEIIYKNVSTQTDDYYMNDDEWFVVGDNDK